MKNISSILNCITKIRSMKNCATFLWIVIVLIAVAGCKKSSDNKSKTEFLTQAPWIVSNVEEKNATGSWIVSTDWSATAACEKDDLTIFRTNGTYETNEGPTKCSPSDPHINQTGTWSFLENETKMKVDTDVVTIEQLDESTLKIVTSYSFSSNILYFRATMRH